MSEILVLKKRKDFLRVAKGVRMVVPTVILQAAHSLSAEPASFKVGYTTTKKIGPAHVRNRTRRRLRAVVREVFPDLALKNAEYVLIGRYNTAYCPYQTLKSDLKRALKKANKLLTGTNDLPAENVCETADETSVYSSD